MPCDAQISDWFMGPAPLGKDKDMTTCGSTSDRGSGPDLASEIISVNCRIWPIPIPKPTIASHLMSIFQICETMKPDVQIYMINHDQWLKKSSLDGAVCRTPLNFHSKSSVFWVDFSTPTGGFCRSWGFGTICVAQGSVDTSCLCLVERIPLRLRRPWTWYTWWSWLVLQFCCKRTAKRMGISWDCHGDISVFFFLWHEPWKKWDL